jgi:tetratricopeptide (TPR) repeat protein
VRVTEYCDQQNLPTSQRLDLFVQVCHAIQHAHQKGIIHRDIKPSNILVRIQDGAAMPVVIDFGVAKAIQQPLTDKTLVTEYDQFIGTPAYMSPEQAEPGGLDIDTRSDVYSLGVLLYELLTGRTPFHGDPLRRSGVDELRRRLREEEPLRPSTMLSRLTAAELTTVASHHHTEPAELTHEVRGELDWVVMKALAKDRTRRYPTASALAEDIRRRQLHEPVSAAAPSAGYRFQKFAQRHRTALASAVTIAALLVAGVVVSAWQAVRATRARRAADTAARKSDQTSAFLLDMLRSVGPSVALGRDTKLLREVLDNAADRVGKDLPGQPAVEAELRDTIGRTYYEIGAFAPAEAMLREAVRLGRSALGARHPKVAGFLNDLAGVLQAQGDLTGAEGLQREALEIYRGQFGATNAFVADTLNNLAGVFWARGDLANAETRYRQVLAMNTQLFGVPHARVATVLNNLASVIQARGDLPAAETLYEQALTMRKRVLGPVHPEVVNSLNNLGNVRYERGDLAGAEDRLREALALGRKVYGEIHPQVAASLHNLANVRFARGDLPGAEATHGQALAMRRTLLGETHPAVAASFYSLGRVAESRGDLAEAEARLRESLRLRQGLAGEADPQAVACVRALAQLSARRGRWQEAAGSLLKVVELQPGEHWNWFQLAPLLVKRGNLEGYQQIRRQMLARFGGATDPVIAERIAKASLLQAATADDLQAAAKLAATALAAGTNHPFLPYFEFAHGLADYRRERLADAAKWLQQSRAHGGAAPHLEAPACFVLAMAQHRQGQAQEARRTLQEGTAVLQSAWPRRDTGDLGPDWQDRLIVELFLDEAKACLGPW